MSAGRPAAEATAVAVGVETSSLGSIHFVQQESGRQTTSGAELSMRTR